MNILVADEASSGFQLSLTIPKGFSRDSLCTELQKVMHRSAVPDGAIIQIWVEDIQPGDDELLESIDFFEYRDLWQMRCDFPVEAETIATKAFIPGIDNEAFLTVNSRAFSWHPEQGQLDSKQLEKIILEDWFDSEGFLLFEIEDRLAGFCWTKIHYEADVTLGEIYAIAVDPDFHGHGFGKPLTLAGLDHLFSAGADFGMLYVEADNYPAIRVYDEIGFKHFSTNRAFKNSV